MHGPQMQTTNPSAALLVRETGRSVKETTSSPAFSLHSFSWAHPPGEPGVRRSLWGLPTRVDEVWDTRRAVSHVLRGMETR